MANRIDGLHKKSVELVDEKKTLSTQSDSLHFDFGIIEELSAGLSDEDDVGHLLEHEKVLTSEIKQTDDAIDDNAGKRREKIVEVDSYIESLEDNLSKLEQMKAISDLGNGERSSERTEKRIGELQEIRELLEGESADSYSLTEKASDTGINQILEKPNIEFEHDAFQEKAFSFPILLQTKETWNKDSDGMDVYNTPVETGKKLDNNQGKVQGFLGTCGIVSCVNVLRLAGLVDASEEQVLAVARKKGLCTKLFASKYSKGGTTAKQRMEILNAFGLESELRECTVDKIADSISEGRGVIISVYASRLWWPTPTDPNATHAITVTSVKKNKHCDVVGFYVCDSGRHMDSDSSQYYSVDDMEFALTGRKMNVTKNIIR